MQFGSTTLVGLLLGQPASHDAAVTACLSLLLAFWLSVSCPWIYSIVCTSTK